VITQIAELAHPVFLLEVTLKGTVILTLALLASQLWRHASASNRHLVLGLAIAGTLLLPLLGLVAPTWDVAPLPALDAEWQIQQFAFPAPLAADAFKPAVATTNKLAPPPAPRAVPWTTWLFWFWVGGATIVCLRLLIALGMVYRILRHATPAGDESLTATVQCCRRRVGLQQSISVSLSHRAALPFTWGWFRPRIVLPADSAWWPESKLEIVLLHEMAHIKRWDTFSTGLAQLAAIVYWFNPLLWLVRRQLLVERECASDDCVLGTGIKASEYAGCLVEMARVLRGRRWLPELQVAMARKTKLEERITMIVNEHRPRSSFTRRRSLLWGLALAGLTIVPLASFQIFAQGETTTVESVASNTSVTSATTVSPAQQQAMVSLLSDLHEALYKGDDYEDIRSRFLTSDYFDDPERTFENWSPARRDELMDNTLAHIRRAWGIPEGDGVRTVRIEEPPTIKSSELLYRAELLQCQQRDGEFHLTHRVNIGSDNPATDAWYFVRDLEHTVVFTEQNGELRISRYDGGVNVQRMDVNNPYGPIFIVTIDGDAASVPTGPMLFKSIPRAIVPNAKSMIPLRGDLHDK